MINRNKITENHALKMRLQVAVQETGRILGAKAHGR
jgi:hypothetical protein